MDTLSRLNTLADTFTLVRQPPGIRMKAAQGYGIAISGFGDLPETQIAAVITGFAGHVEKFMTIAENPLEPRYVRVDAMRYAIGTGIKRLRDAADRRKDSASTAFFQAAPFFSAVTQTVDFPALLDRLLLLAEKDLDDERVRREAITLFDDIALYAEESFGLTLDRDAYDCRFLALAEREQDAGVREDAVNFGMN